MSDGENKNNNESGSDKTPGKTPKEPKNPSDSEYYINKKGKKVKRYYKKRTEEEKKKKQELEKQRYRKKAEDEGRNIVHRESLVGLTDKEIKDRIYKRRRSNILKQRAQDIEKYPILKDITTRRKNKGMTQEEIESFDKETLKLKKLKAKEYWEANKHRDELKRPWRYEDRNNLWENPSYWESLKGRKNLKFVKPNLKDKEIPAEVIPEEIIAEEVLPEESLPEVTLGKAKVTEEMNTFSEGEYLPESSQDSTSEDDLYQAMKESREQARKHSLNKKGESSKGPK